MEENKAKYTVAQIAEFKSVYGSNFIASLKALGKKCNVCGIRQLYIFPEAAAQRGWCKELIDDGNAVYFLPLGKSIIYTSLLLARIAAKENIDIFHTHFSYFDIIAWLTALFRKMALKRSIVVWHRHSDFPIKQNALRKIKDFIKHRLFGNSCYTICVSENLYIKAIKSGFSHKRAITINNGIERERAVKVSRSKNDVLSDLKINESTRLLLMFGWSPLVKGVDITIEAVRKINRERNDIVLGIVGREELCEFVHNYFIGNIPLWLKILPPVEQPADYYQCADIFITASRNEGFPYSVVEALLNECNVIMSDIPGVDWAHDLPNGVFFQSGNTEDLSKKIITMLQTDVYTKKAYAKTNCDYVKKNHSVDKWCNEILGLYNKCLTSKL